MAAMAAVSRAVSQSPRLAGSHRMICLTPSGVIVIPVITPPSNRVIRVSPSAPTDGTPSRLFSGAGGSTCDALRSSLGWERKFSSVPDGIPNQPQRAVADPGDTHRDDKLLDLVERLTINKDQERALMEQLADLTKRVNECHDKIKDVETETKLLSQKYDFFKENNDTRIQNIQYGVVKYIAGMVTFVAGGAVTCMKLKDFTTGWKQWFD